MNESAATHHEKGIAIVGLAGRFPGAPTVKDFWRNLTEGVEGIQFASDRGVDCRWSRSRFDRPSGLCPCRRKSS